MKKRLARFLILFFIVYCHDTEAQFNVPKTGIEFQVFKSECNKRTKAGIKYRRDIKIPVINTSSAPQGYCERYVKFNPDGTPNEIEYLDDAGRKKAIVIYQYSKSGLPQREMEFHPTGTISGRTDYKYDYKGRMLEKSLYDQFDYIISKTIFQIKEEENSICEIEFSSPEMVSRKVVWHYSQIDTGKLISVDEYDGESLLKTKRKISYQGDKIKSEDFFNPKGLKLYTLEYIYNSEGQLIKILRVFSDKSQVEAHSYQYNNNGMLAAETEFDMQGRMKKCYKYSYE